MEQTKRPSYGIIILGNKNCRPQFHIKAYTDIPGPYGLFYCLKGGDSMEKTSLQFFNVIIIQHNHLIVNRNRLVFLIFHNFNDNRVGSCGRFYQVFAKKRIKEEKKQAKTKGLGLLFGLFRLDHGSGERIIPRPPNPPNLPSPPRASSRSCPHLRER